MSIGSPVNILNNNTATTTLPAYKLSTHRNDIVGIRVLRPHYEVYYYRTNRGAEEIINDLGGSFFEHFVKKKRILDLGCGDGSFVNDLRKLGISITGVDLHLNQTQRKTSFFQQGDAFEIPSSSGVYDTLISSWSVFHYEPLSQMRRLMIEAHRVLSHQGSILIPSLCDLERVYQIKIECRRLGMSAEVHHTSNTIRCVKTSSRE